MSIRSRLLIILLIMLVCVSLDQATKVVARRELAGRPPIYLAGGLLRLEYAENSGAFLSLGADWPAGTRALLLGGLAGIMVLGALGYALLAKSLTPTQLVGLALLAGGGMGNLIDRVTRGGMVTDFAVLSLGPLQTGVFNIADVAIVCGLALVVLASARTGDEEREAS